jgi:hypothetical protein
MKSPSSLATSQTSIQSAKRQKLSEDIPPRSTSSSSGLRTFTTAATTRSEQKLEPPKLVKSSLHDSSNGIRAIASPSRPPNSTLPKSLEKAILFSQSTAASKKTPINRPISSPVLEAEKPSSSSSSSQSSTQATNKQPMLRDEVKTSKILESIIPKPSSNEAGRDRSPVQRPVDNRRHSMPASGLSRSSTAYLTARDSTATTSTVNKPPQGTAGGNSSASATARKATAWNLPSTSQSSNQTSIEAPRNPNKSYYPRIAYRIPNRIMSMTKSSSSDSHAEIVTKLVDDICKVETAGLSEYFKASTRHKDRNEGLQSNLLEILSSVKEEVAASIPEDADFLPEVSSAERALMDKMVERIAILEKYEESIKEYDSNIDLLSKDFNFWLSSVPESELLKVDTKISVRLAD